MTTTEHHGGGGGGGSSVAMLFRGRSMLSLRRNQVVSMEQGQEHELQELDLFQARVADRLLSLLPNNQHESDKAEHLLSLQFLGKLLDAVLGCEEEFKSLLLLLLSRNQALISKPPLDRFVADLLDRTVKSLDACNAVTLALDSLRHWHRHADIAVSALLFPHHHYPHPPLNEGQLNRAEKALAKLFASMPADSNDAAPGGSWSFGRAGYSSKSSRAVHARSLSSSLSRNWSAAKQMPAMPAAPRGSDAAGLALAVYTMSTVLVLATWALVAAFNCQDRGACAPSLAPPPRHLAWAGPMAALQDLVVEEWKKTEKKGSQSVHARAGLLAETQALDRSARGLMDALRGSRGGGEEVVERAGELGEACRRLEDGVGPLERKMREVFHRVATTRAEVLQCVDRSTRPIDLSIVL